MGNIELHNVQVHPCLLYEKIPPFNLVNLSEDKLSTVYPAKQLTRFKAKNYSRGAVPCEGASL